MLKNILPIELYSAISSEHFDNIYELRLRVGSAVLVNHLNELKFVTKNGLANHTKNAIICTKQMIDTIIFKATNQSLYSFSEQIKQGFITLAGGIRIGIAGEAVTDSGQVNIIKNFSSLNIRIPHEVIDCSLKVFPHLKRGKTLLNTLVISPPGVGKTTFLRDLALQVYKHLPHLNVLILDERYEIASSVNGKSELSVGQADVLSGTTKQFGFEVGIRSMSPQIIFTDEIATKEDVKAIMYAKGCGVQVIASAHAYSVLDLKNKSYFKYFLKQRVFDRFVVLSNKLGVGTLEGVFDSQFNKLV